MKRTRYILLAGMMPVWFAVEMHAQVQPQDSTLNRTVVVEQEYNPNIVDATKINVLPQVEPLVVQNKEVEYATALQPARRIPMSVMQAYAGKECRSKAAPGYVRLGYGNFGNLDVRAAYRFDLFRRDLLNITFGMDGMDGNLDVPGGSDEWDSYYYRTHAGVDYRHAFDKVHMDIAGQFDLSNFNFMPGSLDGKQKFTAGDVHVGVQSADSRFPLLFRAETNLMVYERQHDGDFQDNQEVLVRTKADVKGNINETQAVGLALGMDNLFYRSSLFEDYTSLGMNPYYAFKNEDWNIRLGVHVDVAFGFGDKFRVAPDVAASYTFAGNFVLYAQAKGGKVQNDFRRLETYNPYGQLTRQLDATCEQLNAALGLKAGFDTGARFNLYVGYQNLKNDLYESLSKSGYCIVPLSLWDTDNLYVGAELNYDYKGVVTFTGNGIYRKWSAKDDGESLSVLAYKPKVESRVQFDIHLLKALDVQVGFLHIARGEYNSVKADPVSNLYLGGSYEFVKGVSAYVRANNLLNKDYQLHGYYPTEGINFVGGVSFRF